MLHGSWEMHLERRFEGIRSFRLSADSGTVVYNVVPTGGGAGLSATIDVPAELDLRASHFANGSAYMAGEQDDREYHYWWDVRTGEQLGAREVGPVASNVTTSVNGRAISFFDKPNGVITVVDAVDPTRISSLNPGGCLSDTFGDVSADGRWYAVLNCDADLILFDLEAPDMHWTVPAAAAWFAGFAGSGPEILWLEARSHLIAYDAEARTKQLLYPRAGTDGGSIQNRGVALDRESGILVLLLESGRLQLQEPADGSVFAELPFGAPATASLDLIATLPPGGGSHSHYELDGHHASRVGLA
mgnify:CR=1 FL=1